MTSRRYSIDASSIITAWRFYERVEGFWASMKSLVSEERAWLVEEAWREIGPQSPDLIGWLNGCDGLVHPIDAGVYAAFIQSVRPHYDPDIFKNNENAADPWVIALAVAHECMVVTEEHPSNATKNLKIPDVCRRLGVEWISIAELVRQEDWRF